MKSWKEYDDESHRRLLALRKKEDNLRKSREAYEDWASRNAEILRMTIGPRVRELMGAMAVGCFAISIILGMSL